MNGDHTERLPQEVERHQDRESGILESASAFAQRVLEEIEALAGATACKSGGAYYTNGQHDIFDAVDGNVLIDDEGNIFFIDTIIYSSGTGGVDKYNSLSPRANSPRKER